MPTWQFAQVEQAQSVVSMQAHCTVEEALELIRQRAGFTGRTVEQIAELVNRHAMSFNASTGLDR